MPKVTVHGFGQVNFPDSMTPQQIEAAISRDIEPLIMSNREAIKADMLRMADPTRGMSGTEKFRAGMGKAFTDLTRGAGQLVGLGPSGDEVQEQRRLDAPLMRTGAGLAGNIAGNVVPAIIPGAAAPAAMNTVRGAAAVGGGMGLLEPIAGDESRALNVAKGAGAGALGQKVAQGVGRVLSPQTREPARQLMEQGVQLTPGQILGGAVKRIEEGATSVPLLGDVIRGAQRRSTESLNKVALQRALTPIGEKVENVGYEGVKEVGKKLGQAYDDLLPKLRITSDPQLGDDVGRILENAKTLPKAEWDQLHAILNKQISKFDKAGRMSGETMKGVESELGQLSRGYRRDASFDKRQLGEAIEEMQAAIRSMVERANPEYAGELAKINMGWANFLRVQRAAGAAGSKEGVFSAEALRGSVKALDPSRNKGAFARGDALMQDLARSGETVLGRTVPDSGTPFRLMNIAGAGALPYMDPLIPLTVGAAALPYTQPLQRATTAMLTKRPEIVRAVAPQTKRLGILAPSLMFGGE